MNAKLARLGGNRRAAAAQPESASRRTMRRMLSAAIALGLTALASLAGATSILLGADPTNPETGEPLLYLGSVKEGAEYFMYPNRVRRVGGFVEAWVLSYHERDKSVPFRLAKTLDAHDCDARRTRTLSQSRYTAKGTLHGSEQTASATWSPVVPDSVGETILEVACAVAGVRLPPFLRDSSHPADAEPIRDEVIRKFGTRGSPEELAARSRLLGTPTIQGTKWTASFILDPTTSFTVESGQITEGILWVRLSHEMYLDRVVVVVMKCSQKPSFRPTLAYEVNGDGKLVGDISVFRKDPETEPLKNAPELVAIVNALLAETCDDSQQSDPP